MPARYLNKGIVLWQLNLSLKKHQILSQVLSSQGSAWSFESQRQVSKTLCVTVFTVLVFPLYIRLERRRDQYAVFCPVLSRARQDHSRSSLPPLPILFTLNFGFQIGLIHNYASNTSFLPSYPSVSFFFSFQTFHLLFLMTFNNSVSWAFPSLSC